MLDWLYTAVAWVIMKIHAGLSMVFDPSGGLAWGLSIVLLTALARILIFPLFVKQLHASRKMQDLSPKVQELRKKYKNDKQRLNQEIMKMYQEAGANPLSGCLPLVAQFPIFIALFTVLQTIANGREKYGLTASVIKSAHEANIFGAPIPARFLSTAQELAKFGDVSPITVKIVIGCALVISSITTFLTMRQSIQRSMATMADNPMAQQMKIMMYFSPLFALFGMALPIGVLIYWVTTNVWTLAQQHYVYRKYPQPALAGNGGAASGGPPSANGSGGRGLLARLRRAQPAQPAQPVPPQQPAGPKVIRNQPANKSRSKRGGRKR